MWLMRAGRSGEREATALRHRVAVVGWEDLPDMTACATRAGLETLLRATYPEQKPRTLHRWHGQLWTVRNTVKVGDLAMLPMKSKPEVALGLVDGPYQYRPDLPGGPLHTRPVNWVAQVPRRAFDTDILFSLGAYMSVCRIARNDAEQRVRTLMELPPELRVEARPPLPDLEEHSSAMIHDRIAQRFKGHALADLVACLLEAQGFKPRSSPPGADGGVDILAGSGPLGFDAPRLVVQVKSQDTRLDVRVLRELAGVMARYDAGHGLLVGWGGFAAPARAEAASDYFRIRLWEATDVVAAVKEHYAALPLRIRKELPMKQVWTLVPGEMSHEAA